MSLALEWVAFARDLTLVSSFAVTFIYLYKLVFPSFEIDRLAYLGLTIASLALASGLALGLWELHAVPLWALFGALAVPVFWLLESELLTRLFGLALGLVLLLGVVALSVYPPYELAGPLMPLFARMSSLAAAGLLSLGGGTLLLALLHYSGLVLTSRKSGRFFALTPTAIAEIAFRLQIWALPVLAAGLIAAVLGVMARQLPLLPVAFLGFEWIAIVSYAVRAKPRGQEPRFFPIHLLFVSLGAGVAWIWLGGPGALG